LSESILVVDDDPDVARFVEVNLRSAGYDVQVATDGEEALEKAVDMRPDLVLLDVMMPKLDGFEVAQRLRRDQRTSSCSIIMLTAKALSADKVLGLSSGADDYIIKPFDPDELRARVAVGVRVLGLQQKLAERVAELQDALSNVKQLHGLLPICSYCKRIRGDDQYWQQVEGYIADHSEAQFSHGICPACYDTISAELDEMSRAKMQQKRIS
jgi:DNA-binding response OmpR family regulator